MEMIVSQILFSCDPAFINKDIYSIYLFEPFFLNDNKDIHFAYLPEFIPFNLQYEYICIQPWYYDAQWCPKHGKSLEEASRKDKTTTQ